MKKVLAFLHPGLLMAGLRLINAVDNYAARKGIRTAWGFSVLVKRGSTLLLFDTGPSPEILFFNLKSLGISPDRLRYIFPFSLFWRKSEKYFFRNFWKKSIKTGAGFVLNIKEGNIK